MNRRSRRNNFYQRNYPNYYYNNDPYGMGMGGNYNNYDYGAYEEFDDPYEGMGDFDFPNLTQIQQHLFGNLQHAFQGMLGQLGDGDEEEDYNMNQTYEGLQPMGASNFQSFFSMQGVGPGTVISKSYSSKIDYIDGQPHQEFYQSQSINQIGQDGHKISEKQEAYKNSRTGVQKAAHQRILDDKGIKQIRKRNINTGDQEEHNIFKGMREDEMDTFNKNFNDYRNKIGFHKNYKYLDSINPNKRGKSQNYLGISNPKRNPKRNVPQLGDGNNFPQYRKIPNRKFKGNK